MLVEMRDINTIKPYEGNPRVNDGAVDAVARSIAEYGFRQPIVVDIGGIIIVGHTRYKAALKLGLATVPVHVANGLTPAQARAYRIADNQTATIADWDNDKLILELKKLQEEDFDLSLTGFDQDDLLKYLEVEPGQGHTDPHQIPEPPDQAITQPGDLIVLGNHRVLCGDSGKAQDVDRLLDGQPVHLVVTDPPYGVAVEPRSSTAIAAGLSSFPDASPSGNKQAKLRAKDRPIANDATSPEEFARLLRAWFSNITRVLEPGRCFYVFGGYVNAQNYLPAFADVGLYFSQCLVWHKMHPVLSRHDFNGDFELLYYGWREGKAHVFLGENNLTDVWQVKKVAPQNMVHLTEKPVELAERAMQYSSRLGERVLDLFGGSGSTLIAAERTGRLACLMELDPLYVDTIVTRWEQFTGKKAQRPGRTG
jgi:DNA modification methylase